MVGGEKPWPVAAFGGQIDSAAGGRGRESSPPCLFAQNAAEAVLRGGFLAFFPDDEGLGSLKSHVETQISIANNRISAGVELI
jgi:hypothetical protein